MEFLMEQKIKKVNLRNVKRLKRELFKEFD